jgi:hypothetical protein
MKTLNYLCVLFGVALALSTAGCGPSKAEREAKERERIELEERQNREAKKANEAITNMNKKLGRKPPALDLGVPVEKKPEPVPEKPKEP